MGRQEYKHGSRYTLIAAQGTILLKAKSVATSVETETSYAGNAMLAGRTKLKNLMKAFMVSLRWAVIVSHS
jgi:CO/xanthine dehydrogenase FAD-binding subunit